MLKNYQNMLKKFKLMLVKWVLAPILCVIFFGEVLIFIISLGTFCNDPEKWYCSKLMKIIENE